MKLFTKLGIYALALFSLNILHAKEDEPLEVKRIKAESAIQQIKEIKSGIKPENFTGRDLTHLLYEAEMNKELLSAESKKYLSSFDDFTKTFTDYYTTPDKYFRIYYKLSGPDAIPETDDNGNFEADFVETYGRYLSESKAKYEKFGLKMPYSSDSYYAIYISNSACSDGVYGFTRPLSYGLTIASYVVLRSDYSGFGVGKPHGFADSVAAQITAAHEFQHSVQMGYAYSNMSMFLMEGCAVWSEQFVYPDEKDPVDYLRSIFPFTNLGLNFNPRAEYNPNDKNGIFPYGTWIFFKYLTDNYGDNIIRELYEELAKRKEVPAFDVVLAKYNTSFSKAAQDFFTTMIDFPSDPAKKPYYISIGDYLNSNANSSRVDPTNYYNYINKDTTFKIDSKTFTTDSKKMLNRLSSVYFKVITDRGASLKIKTARSNDSIVVVVYQYNKAGSHNNFKTTSVNAFAAQEAVLEFAYDPTLPDVMIQVYNATTKYVVSKTSYEIPTNTAFYTIEYSTAKVSVDGDISLAKDFSLVNVYPMPVSENAVMNLSVGVPTMLNYRIYDASGKVVLSNSFFAEIGQVQHNLNTNGLTTGTYFLEVNNGIKSEKMNFIVK